MKNPIMLIGTNDRLELLVSIQSNLAQILGQEVEMECNPQKYFTDGAPNQTLENSVRGKHVYVVTDPNSNAKDTNGEISSINDNYMTARALTKIAKNFGAKTVSQIRTTFPYARDDKYDNIGNSSTTKRTPNLANLAIQDMVNDGNDYCITLDLHNHATFNHSGNTKFVNLGVGRMFQELANREGLDVSSIVLSGCDEGGLKKIMAIAKGLKASHITTLKQRDYSKEQEVDTVQVSGEIEGKDVILYDDMVDTGGTLCKTIEAISQKMPNSLNVLITHALLNGKSLEKLTKQHEQGLFNKIYISNTVKQDNLPEFFEVIDTSIIFANTIGSISRDEGIDYNNNSPIV